METIESISTSVRSLVRSVITGFAPRPRGFRVRGRLVHRGDPSDPLHHVRVELCERDPFIADELLAVAITDREGRFDIEVSPARMRNSLDAPDVRVKVVWVRHSWQLLADKRPEDARVFLRHDAPDDFTGMDLDLGDIPVTWWEYLEKAKPVARVEVPPLGPWPDHWAPGYIEKKLLEGTPSAEVFARHAALALVDALELSKVQADYPPNRTIELEREQPGLSRSDAFLGELMLNGFNAARVLRTDTTEPGCSYRIKVSYDAYEMDGWHFLPDADCEFALVDGKLQPRVIRWSMRNPGETAPFSERSQPREVRPSDGVAWAEAKRIFRVADYSEGQFTSHLTDTHVNMEQYAIAMQRALLKNPVRDLLLPHLREVALINNQGTFLIIGPEGVLSTNTALTPQAVVQRITDRMGGLDWYGWKPAAPISDAHVHARCANIVHDAIADWVDDYFAEHAAGIAAEWWEVERFSDLLVGHAAPYKPVLDRDALYDTSPIERADGPARTAIDGVVRAVRPVRSLDDLKAVCRYVLFHCTFAHTWANDGQLEVAGESVFCSFSLRGAGVGPEHDESIAQKPLLASKWLLFVNQLVKNGRGFVIANEDGDVPAPLRERLLARKEELARLGYDADKIRSRINI